MPALNTVKKKKICEEDFTKIKVIGQGQFARVILVRKKDNKKYYAMKVIEKRRIVETEQIEHTKSERFFVHPFICRLHYAFQSSKELFLVLDYVNGGDLFYHLQKKVTFPEETVRVFAAEIFCSLKSLHEHNVIYRDLKVKEKNFFLTDIKKPENILVDKSGHIVLTDFGLAKILKTNDGRTNTFCGSAEYLPPEVLLQESKGYTKINEMYALIVSGDVLFPTQSKVSENAKDIILKLLEKNPTKRLGFKNADDIINHKFFRSIDVGRVMKKKVESGFVPKTENEYDTQNFDEQFLKMDINGKFQPKTNISDKTVKDNLKNHFKGFDYVKGTHSSTPLGGEGFTWPDTEKLKKLRDDKKRKKKDFKRSLKKKGSKNKLVKGGNSGGSTTTKKKLKNSGKVKKLKGKTKKSSSTKKKVKK